MALELALNMLTGPIPAGLGKLGALEVLHLDNNALSGPVPPLGGLGNITSLLLQRNALSGPIAPQVEALICRRFSSSQSSRLCSFADQRGAGLSCAHAPCVQQQCHACGPS